MESSDVTADVLAVTAADDVEYLQGEHVEWDYGMSRVAWIVVGIAVTLDILMMVVSFAVLWHSNVKADVKARERLIRQKAQAVHQRLEQLEVRTAREPSVL